MFTSVKQLERYERKMKIRNLKDEAKFWLELVLIVSLFVAVMEIAYRLSSII